MNRELYLFILMQEDRNNVDQSGRFGELEQLKFIAQYSITFYNTLRR